MNDFYRRRYAVDPHAPTDVHPVIRFTPPTVRRETILGSLLVPIAIGFCVAALGALWYEMPTATVLCASLSVWACISWLRSER